MCKGYKEYCDVAQHYHIPRNLSTVYLYEILKPTLFATTLFRDLPKIKPFAATNFCHQVTDYLKIYTPEK